MASNAVTLSPIRFVRSLALQFCSTVKGFTERLIESPQIVSVLKEGDSEDGAAISGLVGLFRILKLCADPSPSLPAFQ